LQRQQVRLDALPIKYIFVDVNFFTIVIGTADELTGQAVYAFVTLKPCVFYRSQKGTAVIE
jgi:hypothetical protein